MIGGSNSVVSVGHGEAVSYERRRCDVFAGVRGFSPGKFWKFKAEWWHLKVFMALFSCQNQITKCTLCHENTLKYIYLLNDFHADILSNMLWHYASHHTVFNSNSIKKLIYFITIFKWHNTRNVKCKIFNQTVCRKICNLWLWMIWQRGL